MRNPTSRGSSGEDLGAQKDDVSTVEGFKAHQTAHSTGPRTQDKFCHLKEAAAGQSLARSLPLTGKSGPHQEMGLLLGAEALSGSSIQEASAGSRPPWTAPGKW